MADKNTLKEFYGKNFNGNALPKQVDIEVIPKNSLIPSLENASRQTTKGKYGKGTHSFKILAMIDAKQVLNASKWAERLVSQLKAILIY